MMSTDSMHHAFQGLNLTDLQHDRRKQSQQQQQQQQHTTPPCQPGTGSLRSPTILTSDLPGQYGYPHPDTLQSTNSVGQSAAAQGYSPPSSPSRSTLFAVQTW